MTTNEKVDDLMTRLRPMAVLSGGIWQKGEGVWIDIANYKARVILNGKELICDSNHFSDLDGFGQSDIALEIVRKNISTLPRLKKKKAPVEDQRWQTATAARRNYNIVSRNGRPHAVPYGDPVEHALGSILFGENAPPIRGNNV